MGGRRVAHWERVGRPVPWCGACVGMIPVVLSRQPVHPHANVSTGSVFWSLPEAVGWRSGGEWAAGGGQDGRGVHPFANPSTLGNLFLRNTFLGGKKSVLIHFSILSE